MILVSGGTGMLGSRIVSRLLERGWAVRVLTRNAERAEALAARGAHVQVGDLTDPASLRVACGGATHVITTANAFMARDRRALADVDERGNRNLIDAAKAAGVERFVFTSALLPEPYFEVDYFAAKRGTEHYLRASGLTWTILRPSAFMEVWAAIVGEPILAKGATQIFGNGRTPMNFVAVDDVAAIAVLAMDDPAAANAEVEIVGPENLTLLEVAEVFERIKGEPARKRHIPVPAMRLLAAVLRPFNPLFARQVRLGLLTATTPQACDPSSRARWDVPMTRLEDWARERYGDAGGPAPAGPTSSR